MSSLASNWRPTASIALLKKRSKILAALRQFFAERQVLEVDTPLLGLSSATDPHINSVIVNTSEDKARYLQTSPEFAMKRLLAAGSGCIYQITKAFRAEEQGRLHNLEFTMLEWYRVGFDHHQLMAEMDELLQLILHTPPAERISYTELFKTYLRIDPLNCTAQQLEQCAHAYGLTGMQNPDADDADFWRYLLITHCIEPQLGKDRPIFVVDFPISQAALAKIRPGHPPTAERFEVYFRGIELANGYHELTDAAEQERRFMADNLRRQAASLPQIPVDENLLAALAHGLPNCSGVALGIDRLVMLAAGKNSIADVTSFA